MNCAKTWEDRFRVLVRLGKSIPEFPEAKKIEKNLIQGCSNDVYFLHLLDEDSGALYFIVDTEVKILKGLIAFLFLFIQGKTPTEINHLDLEEQLKKYQLLNNLSQSRNDGLRTIITMVRKIASKYMN